MDISLAKKIRTILLVIACITCVVGVKLSRQAEAKAARDISKIQVTIAEKDSYYNQYESPYTNGCYHIDLTYSITNKTKVEWSFLKIKTYVYDKSGKMLGAFETSFSSSDFRLKVGETVRIDSGLKDNTPDDFFMKLYESELTDLKLESEVVTGTYYNK